MTTATTASIRGREDDSLGQRCGWRMKNPWRNRKADNSVVLVVNVNSAVIEKQVKHLLEVLRREGFDAFSRGEQFELVVMTVAEQIARRSAAQRDTLPVNTPSEGDQDAG